MRGAGPESGVGATGRGAAADGAAARVMTTSACIDY